MFEDETVDVACPQCGQKNSVLVRDFEANAEVHLTCQSCGVAVKIEAQEFRQRLDLVRKELEQIQIEAKRAGRAGRRPRKDDFQI
jgi:transcription elongation factor Elf1